MHELAKDLDECKADEDSSGVIAESCDDGKDALGELEDSECKKLDEEIPMDHCDKVATDLNHGAYVERLSDDFAARGKEVDRLWKKCGAARKKKQEKKEKCDKKRKEAEEHK